jgi:hypothetical protein
MARYILQYISSQYVHKNITRVTIGSPPGGYPSCRYSSSCVTGFLGVTVPTGSDEFTTGHSIYTPTIAAGKGWGTREQGVDIQSTLGISWPDGNEKKIGVPIVWNTALQAHVFDTLWPEVEANYTHYKEGPNAGKSQTLITTGLIVGRYELIGRVRFVIGAGYQQAVSSFRTVNNGWIVTARAPF